jgi:hypothetical protein
MMMNEWPDEPYKGLQYYREEDKNLFAGRDADIRDCVSLLTQVRTSILILHGSSGCGKSSFLRAGVIPAMEALPKGIEFLRSVTTGKPLLIRCTARPIDRIAEEIFAYSQVPLKIKLDDGEELRDLSGIRNGNDDLESFTAFCGKPENLVDVFRKLAQLSPKTLMIIIVTHRNAYPSSGENSRSLIWSRVRWSWLARHQYHPASCLYRRPAQRDFDLAVGLDPLGRRICPAA